MFLKKIDFLSPPVTLYRKEELRHSSIFSGILTIITYLIIIILGLNYFSNFISKKNHQLIILIDSRRCRLLSYKFLLNFQLYSNN